MIKNIFLCFCLLIGIAANAQNIKTSVLVIGATPAGMAAAIQSAKSGVKTLLIDTGSFKFITLSAADQILKTGIYQDFNKRLDSLQKKSPGTKQTLTSVFTAKVFKGWADTVKKLTLMPRLSVKRIEKSGKGWKVDLVKGEIKADILIDATFDFSITALATTLTKKDSPANPPVPEQPHQKFRTSVAVVTTGNGIFETVAMSALVYPFLENFVMAASKEGKQSTLTTGQAAGTIAAYCSFFKTSTKNLDVRKVQSELLTFKAQLIHFDDIADKDSAMIALQHIGLSGILKGKFEDGKLLFMPNATVSSDDIKQSFREYYSRSQLWFIDNKVEKLTLENALSLIKFTASRGEELNKEVQTGWNKGLKLSGKFDIKRVLTRKEFAVLLDTYLQPFSVAVDASGNVKR